MNVVVFTRPRIKAFYHAVSGRIPAFKNLYFASDHKGLEPIWIMRWIYDAQADLKSGQVSAPDGIDYADIAQRCRYLRTLSFDDSKNIISAAWIGIDRLFTSLDATFAFGMVMDSYITDITDRVLRKRGGQYIGFLNNMINGYSRITARGELIEHRDVSDLEVEGALNALKSRTYAPKMQQDFMWNTSPFSMFFTKFLKDRLKLVYYRFKKILDRDPFNFYYNSMLSKEQMTCRNPTYLFTNHIHSEGYEEKIKALKSSNKKAVYFPLQFYPECSIDYWGVKRDFIRFYDIVKRLLDARSDDTVWIVKDHPSATGYRSPSFLKWLVRQPNTIVAPPAFSSNDLIEAADVVLTWTGSVGVEAVVRGLPLVTLGPPYFDDGKNVMILDEVSEIADISKILQKAILAGAPIDAEQRSKNVLKQMLAGLFPGYVWVLDFKATPETLQKVDDLAANLNTCIENLSDRWPYPVRQ